jgi:hypothetical protein
MELAISSFSYDDVNAHVIADVVTQNESLNLCEPVYALGMLALVNLALILANLPLLVMFAGQWLTLQFTNCPPLVSIVFVAIGLTLGQWHNALKVGVLLLAITLVLYKSVLASQILLQVVCKTKDVLISLAKYYMRKDMLPGYISRASHAELGRNGGMLHTNLTNTNEPLCDVCLNPIRWLNFHIGSAHVDCCHITCNDCVLRFIEPACPECRIHYTSEGKPFYPFL